MAEFCTQCAETFEIQADIDVQRIYQRLQPNTMQTVFCEGCEMVAIQKTAANELQVSYRSSQNANAINWQNYL